MIDSGRVAVVGGSFRDPTSQVYSLGFDGCVHPSRILRGLNAKKLDEFRTLENVPFYKRLLEEERVVGTRLIDGDDANAHDVLQDGWAGVLEHDVVPFVSYPYEWSFGMLRLAALLHLRILEDALLEGWTLKDATPYNIQFIGAKPVFIDTPSFEPRAEGAAWVGYRQFCSLFLTPLLLKAHIGIDHLPLLRSYIDGVPAAEAKKLFAGFSWLRPSVLSHIVFPALVEQRIAAKERDNREARQREARPQSAAIVLGLVQSMTRLVKSLRVPIAHSDWSHYEQTKTYSSADHEAKVEFVRRASSTRPRAFAWDLGCNTGTFSQVLAEHAETVVAVDGDHNAIEQLFRLQSKSNQDNILPLVMDLANISPAQGWAGKERMAFDKRRKPNMVLALALVHHMRISANVPLSMFFDWLYSLEGDVVIEFVDRQDEMVEKLLKNKNETYPDYTKENFIYEAQKRFSVVDRLSLKGEKRELFHLVRS